jgi:hypothetical protein
MIGIPPPNVKVTVPVAVAFALKVILEMLPSAFLV